MKARLFVFALFVPFLFTACGTEPAPTPLTGLPEPGTPLEQPELLNLPNGEMVLFWTARGDGAVDLFASTTESGAFQPAVRVNPDPGTVNRVQIDEMRPAVAVGPDDQLAVAWTDAAFDIQLAVSGDSGRSFAEPVRLNRDTGDALQEFPSLAYDRTGRLHAVWLDPRRAGPDLEEPADLYYTTFVDGVLGEEINLTADQDSSVCGCCLPDVDVDADGEVTITFRNTTADGYRDPFRITGRDGQFSAPRRVSPPVWKIDACPIAGPIGVGEMTLWLDGSAGPSRLLSAFDPAASPDVVLEDVVLEDGNSRFLLVPPRNVDGLPDDAPVILVPMADQSQLIVPEGHSWRVIADDLPFWVTSAAVHGGQLWMVGTAEGFQYESRPWPE